MDFELNEDQRAILDAVDALLDKHTSVERAIELTKRGDYDLELEVALQQAGFLDLVQGDGTGPLEAALVVEAVARAGGVVCVGASALVAPLTTGKPLPGPVALARADRTGPVRGAATARSLLVLDGEQARVVAADQGAATPVGSSFGYPVAWLPRLAGESLGPGSGARMRSAWRLAVAVEAVGTMDAALGVTLGYVKQRRQFGRAIGSFQAVQHRLAECAVRLEGSRWLAREAAWRGAPEEATCTAAAHALETAKLVFDETHQLSGAIGYTREHDLHLWSMRLQGLRLELAGAGALRCDLARTRWDPAAATAGTD